MSVLGDLVSQKKCFVVCVCVCVCVCIQRTFANNLVHYIHTAVTEAVTPVGRLFQSNPLSHYVIVYSCEVFLSESKRDTNFISHEWSENTSFLNKMRLFT